MERRAEVADSDHPPGVNDFSLNLLTDMIIVLNCVDGKVMQIQSIDRRDAA